eukprot:4669575-Pyramimonas_sp.AAC.1
MTEGFEAEVPDEPRGHDADYTTNTMVARSSSVPERPHTLGNRQLDHEGEGAAREDHEHREHSERH